MLRAEHAPCRCPCGSRPTAEPAALITAWNWSSTTTIWAVGSCVSTRMSCIVPAAASEMGLAPFGNFDSFWTFYHCMILFGFMLPRASLLFRRLPRSPFAGHVVARRLRRCRSST